MAIPERWGPYLVTAACFAIGGALSRNHFRTTQTRFQIVVATGSALAFEAVRRRVIRSDPNAFGCMMNVCAAAAAMTAVKIRIEGRPDVSAWLDGVRYRGQTK